MTELFKGLDLSELGDTLVEKEGSKNRFFNPGLYDDVAIVGAVIEDAKNDPNWKQLVLSLGKAGFEPKKIWLLFPHTNDGIKAYGTGENAAKTAKMMLHKMKEFLVALGVQVEDVATIKGLFSILTRVLTNLDALEHCRLNITFGYGRRKAHAEYVEKGVYHAVDPEGNVVMNDSGDTPRVWDKAAAAYEFCKEKFGEKKSSKYIEVEQMSNPTTANDLKKFVPKKTVTVSDVDDLL